MATINIENDGALEISEALRANSKTWTNKKVLWSELVKRLTTPLVTGETHSQFMAASKAEQSAIKDCGGYVGGRLLNGRRSKEAVQYRQLLTLDVDFSTKDFWYNFTMLYDCAAVIHATHKSTAENPRHRLIIPLSREVTPEEYEPIARRVASVLNIELFDQSTYETNRLMFWPSVSKDIEFYCEVQDGKWLDADGVLATYTDWRNVSEWPTASASNERIKSAVDKQEDPCAKRGLIGAFCRTYSMDDAIKEFLSDMYAPAGDGRYTYTLGTTSGGLVIYDDKFAYSHHATDPCGGKLCNAYDLVRIHKFGHLDTGKEKDGSSRASDKAMERLILSDKAVMRTLGEERLADARCDFGSATDADAQESIVPDEVDTGWMEDLKANGKGVYESSASNISLILRNDAVLKDAFMRNAFDSRRYLVRDTPWRKLETSEYEPLRDVDYSGVRNYIERVYGITGSAKIDDAMALEIERHSFHPVKEYLGGLSWDGVKRLDTLLIDYFGAEDTAYTRAAIRKALCAAVTRIFEPGAKYDTVLILVGPQGTFKSTFLRKLGRDWFSDTFTTMAGKEAYEQLQGAWIIELAELSAFKKSEVEGIKQFISKCDDAFRPAYGRTVEVYKRQCVFFGTTNDQDFLKDPTGNRRFNPIDVRPALATKSVMDMDDYTIDQIWAEAVVAYRDGEPLYFNAEESEQAVFAQQSHTAIDERSGIVQNFLDLGLPEDWYKKDLYDRRTWLDDPLRPDGPIERREVCVAEIWCECLRRDREDMGRYNTKEISDIVKGLPGWELAKGVKRFGIYGPQRYFVKKSPVKIKDTDGLF